MRAIIVIALVLAGTARAASAQQDSTPAPYPVEVPDHFVDLGSPLLSRWEGQWGYISRAGEVVIPVQFTSAEPFSEGVAAVCKVDECGFIGADGKFVLRVRGRRPGSLHEGLAQFQEANREGFMDRSGKTVIPPKYAEARRFAEGLAAVKDPATGKFGFINRNGKLVVPPRYDDAEFFSQGLAAVQQGKLWGAIDKTGKLVLEPLSEVSFVFADGVAPVRVTRQRDNPEWFYVDQQGKPVWPFRFTDARPFSEGLAGFRTWNPEKDPDALIVSGYLDRSGKAVLLWKEHYELGEFRGGLATVCQTSMSFAEDQEPPPPVCVVVDRAGKAVWKSQAKAPEGMP